MYSVCAWPWSYDHRPSHLHNAGTEHVGFSPTRQALLAPGVAHILGRRLSNVSDRSHLLKSRTICCYDHFTSVLPFKTTIGHVSVGLFPRTNVFGATLRGEMWRSSFFKSSEISQNLLHP